MTTDQDRATAAGLANKYCSVGWAGPATDAIASALAAARAAGEAAGRERAERERDALIGHWPATGKLGVDQIIDGHPDAGKWLLNRENYKGMATRLFDTKLDAIRVLCGLASTAGETNQQP